MPPCARQNNPADAIVPRRKACGAPVLSRHYAASGRPSSWRRGRPLLFCLVDDRQLRVHARAETFNDRARRLAAQDAMTTRAAPAAAPEAAFARPESFARPKSRVELSFRAGVLVAVKIEEEATMGRGLLLWLIGIPIPIILLIWLFGGLHG